MKLDKKRLQAVLRAEFRLKQRMDAIAFEEEVVAPATEKLEELTKFGISLSNDGVRLTDVNEWIAQADTAIEDKREELRLQIVAADAEATEAQVAEAKANLRLLEQKARQTKRKARGVA